MKSAKLISLVSALVLFSTNLFAQVAEEATPAMPSAFSAAPAIGKMIAALLIVLVVMYVAFLLLKRFTGGRMIGGKGKRALQVIEMASLAPKKAVAVVRVADKAVMVGITDHQINLLSELSADETAELLKQKAVEVNGTAFDDLLATATKKITALRTKRQDAVVEASVH